MIKKIILLAAVVAVALLLRESRFADMLTLEALKSNADALRAYVSDNYIISVLAYIVGYIIIAGLNIPGAAVVSIGGGYVFGAIGGTIYALTGATFGACLAFLGARYIMGDGLNKKYESQLAKLNRELNADGYLYMLTLRLIPVFPFFLINILAGLTKLRLFTFFWTTYIGMIPGGFVFVYAGSRLNQVNSVKDIFSGGMLSALVLFGLLMLIPVVYKKVKGRG